MLCLLALIAPSAVAQPEVKARLSEIQSLLAKGHPFTADDQKFVLDTENGPHFADRMRALAILNIAADVNLFPRSKILAITEKRMIEHHGVRADTYCKMLRLTLKLAPSRDGKLISRMQAWGNPMILSSEDRKLASTCLANPKEENRRLAAGFFVSKSQLVAAPTKWMIERIDARIKATQGNAKEFWQTVRRVVWAKNWPKRP